MFAKGGALAEGIDPRFYECGGRLDVAREAYPDAPAPWIDLSTAISPWSYPFPALSGGDMCSYPDACALQRLTAAAKKAYRAPPVADAVPVPGVNVGLSVLPWLFREPKRVAVLHDKSTYGQGLADYFKGAVEGKAQVVFYDGVVQRDPDYKAVLTSMKQKLPDVYFFGGVYPEAGRLVRQAKEIGLAAPMITGDGVYDPTFINIAGKAAEGTYVTYGKDPAGLSTAKQFMEKYTARFGAPGPYSIYAYDAANIILNAIKATGTTDGRQVAGYISKTTFPGAFGDVSFDKNGDLDRESFMTKVVNGKQEVVAVLPAASAQ